MPFLAEGGIFFQPSATLPLTIWNIADTELVKDFFSARPCYLLNSSL